MNDPIRTETAFQGRRLKLELLHFTDPTGRSVTREIVRHPGAVVILPVLDSDRIVLIRNQRIAVDDQLWELPAGTLEPDELPIPCAARELEEETGYRAGLLRPLTSFYTTPGFCDELIHAFVAEDLTATEQHLDPGEDIEVHSLAVDDVFSMIGSGLIRDAKTIAAVFAWDRFMREPAS